MAFTIGFLLDQLLGDPAGRLHPVCFMGRLIRRTEAALRREEDGPEELRRKGKVLCAAVIGGSIVLPAAALAAGYWLHPWVGCGVEAVLTWPLLACKSLRLESEKVLTALERRDLPAARQAVGYIVGRDTAELDEAGVARAAIETVAENTSDGVIAPMLCAALGGPILAFAYKAVNTMDSTVGYKNERYLDFGRAAAKLDDAANFIPARVSAALMIAAAAVGEEFSAKEALRIFRRDRFNHASPNSAQTEAVCAGALGVRLAGDAKYFGKVVKKPTIGDDTRPVRAGDIALANRLMVRAAWLGWALCAAMQAAASFIGR